MAKFSFISYFMNMKKWGIILATVLIVSISGLIVIGYQTHYDAPPVADFVDEAGTIILSAEEINAGQEVFHKYALMEYGTMFGDGAMRGPDFTAEALHQVSESMRSFYISSGNQVGELEAKELVKTELKKNTYSDVLNTVVINDAQTYSYVRLKKYYRGQFLSSPPEIKSIQIKSEKEIDNLTSFFYWGAWVCSAQRPGSEYSYTHNWPFDPSAGNTLTPAVILWSVIGAFTFILILGLVLYYYSQLHKLSDQTVTDKSTDLMTNSYVAKFKPTSLQKATYKYFLVAALLFLIQVLSGILTVHDFVGFVNYFGYNISIDLPITTVRSLHIILSVYWISTCWIGASLFILPFFGAQDETQTKLAHVIFWLLFVVVGGTFFGILFGQSTILESSWYWIGNQGWEFVEMGKVWQIILFITFIVWTSTIYQGVRKYISRKEPWALPNWLVYTTVSISVLFISGFVATPETNFVIADFWRWCVIHMWAESFFEVFTTLIVGAFMLFMGLVNMQSIIRVLFIGTILFLGSGLLGISHNFYWNAKPEATMAIGSVFSTLQVIPLILLTLEAWRFKKLPEIIQKKNGISDFGMNEVFLFLLGVNFWNFLGAGVFGFIINLPVVNYFEHGTYLTVNHGHAALMGVYGNLSVAAMFFCGRLMTNQNKWSSKVSKQIFWSLNLGLLLMVVLDLFPAGIHQFNETLTHGLWSARSQEFISGNLFQSLTWMRIVGGVIFILGGVIPLTWLMIKGFKGRKKII